MQHLWVLTRNAHPRFGLSLTELSLLGLRNHMISSMPCSEASIVSPKGTPSRSTKTVVCPFVSTQSNVTLFQHHVDRAAIYGATRLRPETGTAAARTNPPPSAYETTSSASRPSRAAISPFWAA